MQEDGVLPVQISCEGAMRDDTKTKEQLIDELSELRSQNAALEKSIAGHIAAQLASEEINRYMGDIADTIRQPLLVLDENLRVTFANKYFYSTYKVTPGDTLESFIYDLGNKQWDIPMLRMLLEKILPEEGLVINFEVSHDFPDIGQKTMLLNACQILRKNIAIQAILVTSEDITDRKQIEKSLADSEKIFRRLFETSNDGIVLLEKHKGIITHANVAAEEMLGYSTQECLGSRLQDIGVTLDIDDFQTTIKTLNMGGIIRYDDITVKTRSGNLVHTDIYFVDRSSLVQCNIRDITKRKQAEEALLSSEQRLADIIEFLPDATLVIDKEGKVIAWNRAIEIMTGVKAAEILGKGDYEYALPFYGERRPILIDLALHPESEREKSYTHIQKMGDILFGEAYTPGLIGGKTHLSATASVLRDAGGETVAAIECIRDDTQRRRAQEELKSAEERYRSIFENAQEGIYRSTPEGRIILANKAMANMFGYKTPEELMTNVTDVARQFYVNPEERTKLIKIIEEQGTVVNHETQFHRNDGSVFWVSMTMQGVRDEKGQILYYEGIDEDITARKEMDERMRKSLVATVQAIAVIVETRDPYTAGHQRKVADLAQAIAMEMKLPSDRINGIRTASAIHDLGKISVPAEILSNPKKLTTLEFSLIKTHAQSGYDILKDIEFPWPVARMVREHHERMDGSGYPQGLIGEETLLESRILAVADVVESMASHRPYRPALGLDAALEEIENNRGMLYDANAVDACLRVFREKGFQFEGDSQESILSQAG